MVDVLWESSLLSVHGLYKTSPSIYSPFQILLHHLKLVNMIRVIPTTSSKPQKPKIKLKDHLNAFKPNTFLSVYQQDRLANLIIDTSPSNLVNRKFDVTFDAQFEKLYFENN